LRPVILFLLIFMVSSNAYGAGLTAHYSLNYGRGESFEDGEETSTIRKLNQTYTLSYERPFTPAISYRFSLRTNLSDQESVSRGAVTERSLTTIEPLAEIKLVNPRYEFLSGIRLQETWTKTDSDERRTSSDFIYARLDPYFSYKYPTLSAEYTRRHQVDHNDGGEESEGTTETYGLSSSYFFNWKLVRTTFNFNYGRTKTETPEGIVSESVSVYNFTYLTNYSKTFWKKRGSFSATYQGSFSRSENRLFVPETGDVVFRRSPLGGFHALGTFAEPDVDVLSSEPRLAEEPRDINTSISSINIGTESFHNMGMGMRNPGDSVDRLFIYVRTDLSLDELERDLNLVNAGKWLVFSTDVSSVTDPVIIEDEWSSVPIMSVDIVEVDTINNIFRYEIIFASAQSDKRFYKAVNLDTVDIAGIFDPNVFVTEIEALGITAVSETGEFSSESTSAQQGLSLGLGYRPWKKVRMGLSFSMNRNDTNPDSVFGAVGDFFPLVVTKDLGNSESTTVTKSYGSYVSWAVSRYLSTTARISRSESFDTFDPIGGHSNAYTLGFSSRPINTVDLNLNLRRSESFDASVKTNTNHAAILNVGTQLFKDINMVTDAQVSRSRNELSGDVTTSRSLNGNINARITKSIYTHMSYGVSRDESPGSDMTSKQASFLVSYRPARFFNVSTGTRVLESGDSRTTSASISASWLALPVLRINMSYGHNQEDDGGESDSLGAAAILNLSKRLNLRINASHSIRTSDDIETKSNFITFNLSGLIL